MQLPFISIYEKAKSYIDALDVRQKRMAFLLTGALAGLIVIILIASFYSSIASIDREIAAREKILKEMELLRIEYLKNKKKADELLNLLAIQGESLTTFLDKASSEVGISIGSLNPQSAQPTDYFQEKKVEVSIQKVTLKDLVDFFYKIENYKKPLKITSVNIKPDYANPAYVSVSFTVSSFEKKSG